MQKSNNTIVFFAFSVKGVCPCLKRKRREGTDDENNESSSLVGKLVAVYCPDDDLYYRGKIARKRDKDGHLLVKYTDGILEWINPKTSTFQELKHKDDKLPPRKVSPSLEKVTVGSCVLVWWPAEKEYFGATVRTIKPQTGNPYKLYKLDYDGGDEEWTCLANRKFSLKKK